MYLSAAAQFRDENAGDVAAGSFFGPTAVVASINQGSIPEGETAPVMNATGNIVVPVTPYGEQSSSFVGELTQGLGLPILLLAGGAALAPVVDAAPTVGSAAAGSSSSAAADVSAFDLGGGLTVDAAGTVSGGVLETTTVGDAAAIAAAPPVAAAVVEAAAPTVTAGASSAATVSGFDLGGGLTVDAAGTVSGGLFEGGPGTAGAADFFAPDSVAIAAPSVSTVASVANTAATVTSSTSSAATVSAAGYDLGGGLTVDETGAVSGGIFQGGPGTVGAGDFFNPISSALTAGDVLSTAKTIASTAKSVQSLVNGTSTAPATTAIAPAAGSHPMPPAVPLVAPIVGSSRAPSSTAAGESAILVACAIVLVAIGLRITLRG